MRIRRPAIAFVLLFGCGDDDVSPDSGVVTPPLDDSGLPLDPYSPEGEAFCGTKEQAYRDFVAAHRACDSDADCAVVGDCGPNADFTAVAASAASEAYRLANARCYGAFDGPVFDPRCTEGKCTLEERTDTCCGCWTEDAGL